DQGARGGGALAATQRIGRPARRSPRGSGRGVRLRLEHHVVPASPRRCVVVDVVPGGSVSTTGGVHDSSSTGGLPIGEHCLGRLPRYRPCRGKRRVSWTLDIPGADLPVFGQVMSTSAKPRLAGRQPSSAVGCSG